MQKHLQLLCINVLKYTGSLVQLTIAREMCADNGNILEQCG